MKLKANNKAQMLIEIVIAVGVLALVLVGVSDLMTRSQIVSSYQRRSDEALSIAKKILNDYRTQKESDPSNFKDNVVGLDKQVCVEGKDYSCVVTITKNSNSVNLLIKVSWPEGSNTLNVSLDQIIGNL